MEQAKLDQIFEQKLYNYEVKPQKGSWNRVEKKLPRKSGFGNSMLFLMLASVFSIMPYHHLQDENISGINFWDEKVLEETKAFSINENESKVSEHYDSQIGKERISLKTVLNGEPTSVGTEKKDEDKHEENQYPEEELMIEFPASIEAEDLHKIAISSQKQQTSVKIEITIHPEAILENDTLKQAAPESRPRKIQLLLKQIKRMTLQD